MKLKSIRFAALFSVNALTLGILTACGGGGGGGISISDGGIRGTGSSVGPVSRFGSVFVNGVQFDTSGLGNHVNSDDGIEREDQLSKGMILRVEGTWSNNNQGEAESLEYDDTVRGDVEAGRWSAETREGQITVAGQTIRLTGQTVVSGVEPAALDHVSSDAYRARVSGWRLSDGTFRAAFVGIQSVGDPAFDPHNDVEIEGVIENLTDTRFAIMGVDVDYDRAEFLGVARSELRQGLAVEVEGYFEGNTLIAAEIDEDDRRRFRGSEEEDIEVSGPVFGDVVGREFILGGNQVRITDDTDFDDDLREEDLQDGLLIQVEGEFRNGVIIAEEIERREANAEVEARVLAIFSNGDLNVGGVRVVVNAGTLIEDEDDGVGFDEPGVGDFLEVEGLQRQTADGSFLEAIKIEREDEDGDDDEEFELEGRIEEVRAAQGFFRVLGVEMDVNINTDFGDDGGSLADLRKDDMVEVSYRYDVGSNTFFAEEIELEEEDDD